MTDSFFEFFNKDRPAVDPESPEWSKISFKEYPRSKKFFLPKLPRLISFLSEALLKRKSERRFSNLPLSKETIGALFFWSFGLIHTKDEKNIWQRPYPSGGARYPVEPYLVIFRSKDLPKGAYHYNFKEHALEEIRHCNTYSIRKALPYDFARKAAAVIILSFIGGRTLKKYGNLGYKLGLIEGGHIGQNIYLVGAALGLGVLALGGMDYEAVHKELNMSSEETVFYQLSLGWPKDN